MKKFTLILILILITLPVMANQALGYLMPSEQLIRFMVKNYSKIKTIVQTQELLITNPEGEPYGPFEEKIYLKSPHFIGTENLNPEIPLPERIDLFYRQLMLSNREGEISRFLSQIGVDLSEVSYTRLDGVIAYQIGGLYPGTPKMLIEKERFIPLLISFIPEGKTQDEMVDISFQGYRELEEGILPFEITCSSKGILLERYVIRTIDINMPIDENILDTIIVKSEMPEIFPAINSRPDEERIQAIIRTFEEKYR